MATNGSEERRSEVRLELALPVKVTGFDPDGTGWEELSASIDTSYSGAGLSMRHRLDLGQVVHLILPLPKQLRRHDMIQTSYSVYGIVRALRPSDRVFRVGLKFLGRTPPRDYESRPAMRYLLPGDESQGHQERRTYARGAIFVNVRLARERNRSVDELTVTENLGRGGACVPTTLDMPRKSIVRLTECGGDFSTRAEVCAATTGADGVRRLHLRFLDEEAPERLTLGL